MEKNSIQKRAFYFDQVHLICSEFPSASHLMLQKRTKCEAGTYVKIIFRKNGNVEIMLPKNTKIIESKVKFKDKGKKFLIKKEN